MPGHELLSSEQASHLAQEACRGAGSSAAMAGVLAQATLSAELNGKLSVGFAHLPDYLEGLLTGRINGQAEPEIRSPAAAVIACDVKGGIAQLGFDRAFESFSARAFTYGIALFTLANSFTTGELGWYVRRLSERGLVGLAATNGPALAKPASASEPVYCTNPIAFAVPGRDGPALLIDQSCTSCAYVALRSAAESGADIPADWAVDADGRPTTDARSALSGALLTFGGSRGANISLMVEMLAAALSGANWSLDAPAFTAGAKSPGAGMTVVAIAPGLLDPDFTERVESQLLRLQAKGVHVPGIAARSRLQPPGSGYVCLSVELITTLRRYAEIGKS